MTKQGIWIRAHRASMGDAILKAHNEGRSIAALAREHNITRYMANTMMEEARKR